MGMRQDSYIKRKDLHKKVRAGELSLNLMLGAYRDWRNISTPLWNTSSVKDIAKYPNIVKRFGIKL